MAAASGRRLDDLMQRVLEGSKALEVDSVVRCSLGEAFLHSGLTVLAQAVWLQR